MTSLLPSLRLIRLDPLRLSQGLVSPSGLGLMGSKAFNGCLSFLIGDITKRDDYYLLNNCGNSYDIFSKQELEKNLTQMTESITDKDKFVQWWDCHIL